MQRFVIVMLAACGAATPRPADTPPTCAATADHVLALIEPKDDHARKIRDTFQRRCEQDAWGPAPRACIVSTEALDDRRGCKSKLTVGQREALDRDLDEAERVARANKLPASCERYKQLIRRVATCDKVPQRSRDALQQGFDAMAAGWVNIGELPENARRAMEEGCTLAADAVQQAIGQPCKLTP